MHVLNYANRMPHPDDPAIYEPICDAIAIGHPQKTAAALAGIHADTLKHWRIRGQNDLTESEGQWTPWDELSPCAQFAFRFTSAQAEFTEEALTNWREGSKNWQAWCTLLERRMPDDFGRNQRITTESVAISVSVTAQLSEGQVTELLATLADRQASPRQLPQLPEHASTPALADATSE